jgi:hypothetical protein
LSDLAFKGLLATTLAIAWTIEFASVRSMSPKLRLVANPAIAKFGWRFALIGVAIPLLPFYNPILGVMVLGPSLLVAANNLERLWLARSLGETRFTALLEEAARAGYLKLAIVSFLGAGLLVTVSGGALMLLSSQGKGDWSYWFGLGLVYYGVAIGLMRTIFAMKLHKQSAFLSNSS